MANVYPTSSGVYSTRTWNNCATGLAYGQAPLATDTIYLNGTTLTINQDITVVAIDNAVNGSAVVGGLLVVSGNRIITANIIQSRTNNANYFPITTTVTIIGNILGVLTSVDTTYSCIYNTGNLTVIGNVTGLIGLSNGGVGGFGSGIYNAGSLSVAGIVTGGYDTVNANFYHFGIFHAGVSLSINGQVIGGNSNTLNNNYGLYITASINPITIISDTVQINAGDSVSIYNASTQNININQSVNGNATFKSKSYLFNASSGTININGDVLALADKATTTTGLIQNISTGKIVVSGKVLGGTIANSIAISNTSTGEVIINGDCKSGTQAGSHAYYSITASKLTVLGSTISLGTFAIYSLSQAGINIIKGNMINYQNIPSFYGYNLKVDTSLPQTLSIYDGSAMEFFATSNTEPSQPLQRDTELGTVYGSTSQYTGTMVIPPVSSVFKNVQVGQTVGTLAISAEGVWAVDISQLTVNNSIGNLLKNVSTIQSTAAQIVALK